MVVRCPAKINLFLSVGPADSTGYHPICTVFQAVGLYDTITIERSGFDHDIITCDWPDFPPENTLSKVLRLAREYVEIPALSIHVEKRIPAQAGLGGGSSNAAGLLRAIDRFVPAGLGDWTKQDIAAATGSDVPFFLVGGRAIGEGRGERITPLSDAEPFEITIVQPHNIYVSTADAYGLLDSFDLRLRPAPAIAENPCDGLANDFERVMPAECWEAIEALIGAGAKCAHLCGSGSAVFGIGADPSHPSLQRYSRIWNCVTLSRAKSLALG